MPAILMVTREPSAQQLVEGALQKAGYDVVSASSAEAAIRATLIVTVSAVVLDGAVGPEEVEALSDWVRSRSEGTVGIVFLISVRTRPATLPIEPEQDQLVVKPFSPEQIRQAVDLAVIKGNQPGTDKLRMGNLEVDRTSQHLRGKDAEVLLTPREFQLIEYLALNEGRFVPTEELAEKVWHRRDGGKSAGLVRPTMQNLRSKLSALPNGEELIQTFPRRGYMLGVFQRR
jgi:DNA-binding response OmpR family regulator